MLFYCILLSLSTFCISSDPLGGSHAHIVNRIFDFFDRNGDNVVTWNEFLAKLPFSYSNVENIITKKEFLKAWELITANRSAEEEEENKQYFELLFLNFTNTTLYPYDVMMVFYLFDTNKDEVVGREEFLMEWERYHPEHDDYTHPPEPTLPTTPYSDIPGGPHAHYFNQVFNLFDQSGDNKVTVEEFWAKLPKVDSNDDGIITKNEFSEAWETTVDHIPKEMKIHEHSDYLLFWVLTSTTLSINDKYLVLRVFDTNNDGVISRQEFLIGWERIHS